MGGMISIEPSHRYGVFVNIVIHLQSLEIKHCTIILGSTAGDSHHEYGAESVNFVMMLKHLINVNTIQK